MSQEDNGGGQRSPPFTLVRITAPHFCAGVQIGKAAAPIVSYMRTWSLDQIERYCERKGWRCEVLP